IQQLDPIYVDLTRSATELMQLRRDLESGKLRSVDKDQARVKLLLPDGTPYEHEGRLQFSEVTVDPGTGSVTLRAVFPNPDRHLLPGMYVRALLEEGVRDNAILAPQRGVTRDARGQAVALVVDGEGKVAQRLVVTERAIGDQWLVSEGLAAGDRLIVEGLQKIRPGMPVTVVDAGAAAQGGAAVTPAAADWPGAEPAMARFFIDRPVFAWVIGIVIMLAGLLAIFTLPISQYPQIAPPTVTINAYYPGASAQTLQDTVTQVIEQRMTGIDGLRYMKSTSDSTGRATVTLTFDAG